jgi:hypothetical protein
VQWALADTGRAMRHIDDFIIDRIYSPACGWVSHNLGVDQWRLSIECLNGTIAFHLAAVALTIAGKGMNDGIFADLLTEMAWLGIMEFIRRVAYRQAGSSLGKQTARMAEVFFRTLLVAILPLSIFYIRGLDNVCHTVSLVLFISHLYFKACDSPPPQQKGRFAFHRG